MSTNSIAIHEVLLLLLLRYFQWFQHYSRYKLIKWNRFFFGRNIYWECTIYMKSVCGSYCGSRTQRSIHTSLYFFQGRPPSKSHLFVTRCELTMERGERASYFLRNNNNNTIGRLFHFYSEWPRCCRAPHNGLHNKRTSECEWGCRQEPTLERCFNPEMAYDSRLLVANRLGLCICVPDMKEHTAVWAVDQSVVRTGALSHTKRRQKDKEIFSWSENAFIVDVVLRDKIVTFDLIALNVYLYTTFRIY